MASAFLTCMAVVRSDSHALYFCMFIYVFMVCAKLTGDGIIIFIFFLSFRCGLRRRKKIWRGKRRKVRKLKEVFHSVYRPNTLGLVHITSALTAWRIGRSGSKP